VAIEELNVSFSGPTLEARAAWTRGEIMIGRFTEAQVIRGDFILNARYADRAAVNSMLMHARGLPCLVLGGELYDRLELHPFAPAAESRNPRAPALAATIDAAAGITTGISAADRATTIATAISPDACPTDVRQPGHVPVLRAARDDPGRRPGSPLQAVLELARATDSVVAAVVCEVLDRRGDLAGAHELEEVSRGLRIPLFDLKCLAF
jgi:3,4-dihydroxy 2-butanone 4-phosphate synthase/GTP cyclohydrolase II